MEPCFYCRGYLYDLNDESKDCKRCEGSGVDPCHPAEIDREARRLVAMGKFRRQRAVQKAKPKKRTPSVKRVTVRLTLELTFHVGETEG